MAQSASNPSAPQSGDHVPSLMQQRTDVVIFVVPLSADSARIGVAYNKLLPKTVVKDDLRKLLSDTGWKYGGDLVITDASVQPDSPKQYPPTTAAMLTVSGAPQIRNGAPELLAYRKAFQRYTYVEVNFKLPDLNPYAGVQSFATKSLVVELHKDEGVYRYETEIRDHTNPLPDPLPTATQSGSTAVVEGAGHEAHAAAKPSNHLGVVLFLCGIALIAAGCGTYLLTTRRTPRPIPAQTTLRR